MKVFQGILLILALTTDSFVVSFAYGAEKVEMPFMKVVGMNLIMSSLLGISVFTGNFLSCFLPEMLTSVVCTGILAGMGIYRMLGFLFRKNQKIQKKRLTGVEAALLAFALSLDSLAVGIGTGLVQNGEWMLAVGIRSLFVCCFKERLILAQRILPDSFGCGYVVEWITKKTCIMGFFAVSL